MSVRGSNTSPSGVEKGSAAPPPRSPVRDSVNAVAKGFGETPAVTLDEEQIFMLYASFSGDIARTAHAAGVTTSQVIDLADKGGWMLRIRELIGLKKSDKPGIVEKELSRAMSFVQAHRYRIFLERVIRKLIAMSEDDLFKFLVSERVNKQGVVIAQVFSTRPLADLASALEKVHWMLYQALGDTPQDRLRAKEKPDDGELSETDVHARIAKALATMPSLSPRTHIEEAHREDSHYVASLDRIAELKDAPAQIPLPASPMAAPLPAVSRDAVVREASS